MDPVFVNTFISVALILLAVTAVLLVSSAVPLMSQANRTLIAWEKLADTLQGEAKPTLAELKDVLAGVNQLRSATAARVTEVGHRVEDVAGSFGQVADQAKRHSKVWGTGLLAGIRAYLKGQSDQGSSQTRRITEDGGEKDV